MSSTPRTRWTAICATSARRVTTRLDGLTVVVDCAHGAASAAAPRAYRAAGANVIAINAEPNGLNINDGCGSTHLESLQAAVVSHGADLGLAHDGDADRCLAVDATGRVVDGDAIMVVLALAMQEAGELASNTLVATVMSNLGLHLAMRRRASRSAPPASATATSSRNCAPASTRSAASSPATSSCRRSAPPATASSPGCG